MPRSACDGTFQRCPQARFRADPKFRVPARRRIESPTLRCPTPPVHWAAVPKMVCVVVPVTVRPVYSVPPRSPVRVQVRFSLPGGLIRVKITGPAKLPAKSATGPWGDPGNNCVQEPTPITSKLPPRKGCRRSRKRAAGQSASQETDLAHRCSRGEAFQLVSHVECPAVVKMPALETEIEP